MKSFHDRLIIGSHCLKQYIKKNQETLVERMTHAKSAEYSYFVIVLALIMR